MDGRMTRQKDGQTVNNAIVADWLLKQLRLLIKASLCAEALLPVIILISKVCHAWVFLQVMNVSQRATTQLLKLLSEMYTRSSLLLATLMVLYNPEG